ncbi:MULTISPECIES: inovirus-type Gp2 protein [Psychrobacter]|uniref:Inovirus Gp2 family protein n=1 Tax=Psychrobacter cryohalolentis (strain ATCC BAA-1226 / DSM 17306 / VKM B-2378 / K5) TaxID=335284 RepID=Q1Q873_PSYCK|nr:inovirus-type Gp2 protein [Psychrobacter cryohalolentis]ABE76130.1 hypothetical protein Pcryo_2353 [Psychrobacter cryohalolentis K5]ASE26306.1 inovirus Gp2 family protein [Psychrobacter cryohalolentis]|tara:strand:- start:2000 stop:2890 length:891 start_codon:yes stop_codon:yes gene_type:complete
MLHPFINQSKITNDVDRLVKNLLFNNLSSKHFQDQLNELYRPFMYMHYSNYSLNYSQSINALMDSSIMFIGAEHPCNVIWEYDMTQNLITELLKYKDKISTERYNWLYQEKRNKESLDLYFKNLIERRSRVLVIFIELKYLKDQRHNVNIHSFHNHMKKLRKLISKRNSCFKHLTGYAWALEQGYKNGGFHCHLVLTYDNSKKYSDWLIAKTIGEKWQEITEGVGTYHSSHDSETKRNFEMKGKLGVGRIRRDNPQEVENAFTVARYLTKTDKYDQKLKVWLPKMQTFGHGEFKEE